MTGYSQTPSGSAISGSIQRTESRTGRIWQLRKPLTPKAPRSVLRQNVLDFIGIATFFAAMVVLYCFAEVAYGP